MQPAIALIQSPNGDWNFSKLGGARSAATATRPAPTQRSKTAMDLSVKLVKITGGRFSLGKTGGHARPLVLEDVNIEVHDFSARSCVPLHLRHQSRGRRRHQAGWQSRAARPGGRGRKPADRVF